MAKATLVVFTNPKSAEVEDEYNDWYDNVHLADVLAVDGFVAAQRFRVVDVEGFGDGAPPSHRYMALYEIEGDVEAVTKGMMARAGTDAMVISPALDAENARMFFVEPVGAAVASA